MEEIIQMNFAVHSRKSQLFGSINLFIIFLFII